MKMNISKLLTFMLAMIMVGASVIGAVGCGTQVIVEVDESKTQLYIANYNGGVGETWIDEAAERFMEKYKDYEFETGKKGVQIIIDHNKKYDGLTLRDQMTASAQYEIFFTGGSFYRNFATDELLYDLTDLITEKANSDDNKTIASKLDAETLNALKVNGKIYGIPTNVLFNNIVYDAGVFESKKLYFADAVDTADTVYLGTNRFITNKTDKKSCGPDGIYNTYDDGMPSSYAELYKVMDKMVKNNVTPFISCGSGHYAQKIVQSLYLSYGGAGLLNAGFDFDSKDEPIEIVTGFQNDGTPIIDKVVINKENGYLIRQAAALYYAIEFAQQMRSNEKFFDTRGYSTTFSHINAQEAFINSGLSLLKSDPYVAILSDGNWWYNEAKDNNKFAELERRYPANYSEKHYKVMPLPVQYEGRVTEGNGKAPTMLSQGLDFVFVKKDISAEHIPVMKEFLSFIYSDDELVKFTKVTNGILKAVNYDYSSIVSELPEYSRSVLTMYEAAKEAGSFRVGVTSESIYNYNHTLFSMFENSWIQTDKGMFPITYFDTFHTKEDARVWFNKLRISESAWNGMKG